MNVIKFLKSLNSNLVIAVTALIISGCALLLSLQEIRIMRVQQEATMYPHLMLGNSYNSTGYGWKLKNGGNGIARIRSFKISQNSVFFKDWQDVISSVSGGKFSLDYNIMSTGKVREVLLAAGEEINIFSVRWTELSRELEPLTTSLNIEICYESLLGDTWLLKDEIVNEIEEGCDIVKSQEFNYSM